ncbi:MAG: hypothetical protein EPO62_05980 [Candidatus Nitrosotenuis sp.]|nr:MAG: hypothetical protein EPO62_05980 [Candidatus Nitrosotenuis sp.]
MSSIEMMCNTERLQKMMATAGIELFGIINKNGRILDAWSRKDLRISKEKKEILFMQIALQSSMQRDFDEDLGTVSFCMIKREKLRFIYRPIGLGNTALVVTNKNNDKNDFRLIDDLCKIYSSEMQGEDC